MGRVLSKVLLRAEKQSEKFEKKRGGGGEEWSETKEHRELSLLHDCPLLWCGNYPQKERKVCLPSELRSWDEGGWIKICVRSGI